MEVLVREHLIPASPLGSLAPFDFVYHGGKAVDGRIRHVGGGEVPGKIVDRAFLAFMTRQRGTGASRRFLWADRALIVVLEVACAAG